MNVRVTCVFQSTLPAGEATGRLMRIFPQVVISIRASRGGSDKSTIRVLLAILHFNPRFPRGKRRCSRFLTASFSGFQSTLPAREATFLAAKKSRFNDYFNPRFPRGKRPESPLPHMFINLFQSTLPAGEATRPAGTKGKSDVFQSTLPAGEATRPFLKKVR